MRSPSIPETGPPDQTRSALNRPNLRASPPVPGMTDLTPDALIQVSADRLLDALRHIVGRGGEASEQAAGRFLEFIRTQHLEPDQCWAAVDRRGELRPALIALPNAGRTAMIFVSPPRFPEDVPALARLIRHSHAHFDPVRIALAQVLMEPGEKLTAAAFEQAGFARLATLCYMERRVARLGRVPSPQWPEQVALLHYEPRHEPLFKEALDLSYVETLDCPALCGLRQIDDVLRDHKAGGVVEPELWTLVLWDGRPAAVLLLNPLADGEGVELSYLGVGAEFRGKGLGRRLMALAMQQLSDRPYSRFTLAVDQQNLPAVSLYKSFGLARTDRRLAFIRPVPDAGQSGGRG